MTKIKEIKQGYDAVYAAERALANIVSLRFPIGSNISWRKGGRYCEGRVKRHSGRRLYVVNDHTNRSYWISASDAVS